MYVCVCTYVYVCEIFPSKVELNSFQEEFEEFAT